MDYIKCKDSLARESVKKVLNKLIKEFLINNVWNRITPRKVVKVIAKCNSNQKQISSFAIKDSVIYVVLLL
jgi:hypothetical protein